MEVKVVTPCHVCGGWGDAEEKILLEKYSHYELESRHRITLCYGCFLDELLSLQGELVDYLGMRKSKYTAEGYSQLSEVENPSLGKDKYCLECHKRLALMRIALKMRNSS